MFEWGSVCMEFHLYLSTIFTTPRHCSLHLINLSLVNRKLLNTFNVICNPHPLRPIKDGASIASVRVQYLIDYPVATSVQYTGWLCIGDHSFVEAVRAR